MANYAVMGILAGVIAISVRTVIKGCKSGENCFGDCCCPRCDL